LPELKLDSFQAALSGSLTMMIKTTHNILASVILVCGLALAAQSQSSLTLPTHRDHYKTYDV
jgi:hypothetical protein